MSAARLVAAVVVAAAPGAAAQAAPALRWTPEAPAGGSLVRIIAVPAASGASAVARGTLGDEPLHFDPDTDGTLRALAAVPLGGPDSLALDVVVRDGVGTIAWASTWLHVAPRSVRSEQIKTAATFARTPDSALAARIASERERIRAVFAAAHHTPRLWHGRFVKPRPGRITSGFGTRRIVNGRPGGRHWGVDLAGGRGDPVRATNRGVVALAADTYYGGCAVYLDHGAGLVTGYLHFSAILVSPGDTVDAGQLLGRVGASGRVTGPHLHWLAHYGATAFDPSELTRLEPWPPLASRARAAVPAEPPEAGAVPAACRAPSRRR